MLKKICWREKKTSSIFGSNLLYYFFELSQLKLNSHRPPANKRLGEVFLSRFLSCVASESCVEIVISLLSLSVVNCMCPWCGCSALSYVLAAHLHPRAAPASSGLLLVSLTTSETHACIHECHQDLHDECSHPLLFSLSFFLSLSSHLPTRTHLTRSYIYTHTRRATCAERAPSSATKTSV